MIEVFKTNIKDNKEATTVLSKLCTHYPELKINFDLEDCDKVLRIEGNSFCNAQIIEIVTNNGYAIEVLDY